MVVGLLFSGWTPFVVGRAHYAQSSERRFQRWLANARIDILQLYSALLQIETLVHEVGNEHSRDSASEIE